MIKTSAAEFMKNHAARKRVSVLEPFLAEILELKNAGYSIPQIIEFLVVNDIRVSNTALISFIKVRTRTTSVESDKNDKPVAKRAGKFVTADDRRNGFDAKIKGQVPSGPKKNEQKLVEKSGQVIDVNYKPGWVDDDINLADLI